MTNAAIEGEAFAQRSAISLQSRGRLVKPRRELITEPGGLRKGGVP